MKLFFIVSCDRFKQRPQYPGGNDSSFRMKPSIWIQVKQVPPC